MEEPTVDEAGWDDTTSIVYLPELPWRRVWREPVLLCLVLVAVHCVLWLGLVRGYGAASIVCMVGSSWMACRYLFVRISLLLGTENHYKLQYRPRVLSPTASGEARALIEVGLAWLGDMLEWRSPRRSAVAVAVAGILAYVLAKVPLVVVLYVSTMVLLYRTRPS